MSQIAVTARTALCSARAGVEQPSTRSGYSTAMVPARVDMLATICSNTLSLSSQLAGPPAREHGSNFFYLLSIFLHVRACPGDALTRV